MNRDSTDSDVVGKLGRRLDAPDDRVCEPGGDDLADVTRDAGAERYPHAPHDSPSQRDEPLRLYARCAVRLHERAVLLDPLRVCIDTLARASRAARSIWSIPIEAAIDESIDAVLARDAGLARATAASRTRADVPAALTDAPTFFADAFGLPAESSSHSAAAFHELDFGTRRAFCALLIENRTLEECERTGLGHRDGLAASARVALRTVLLGAPQR